MRWKKQHRKCMWIFMMLLLMMFMLIQVKLGQLPVLDFGQIDQENIRGMIKQHVNISTTTEDPLIPHCNPVTAARVIGKRRTTVGYMTIGIPSIARPKTTEGTGYLNTTISSMIENLQPEEKSNVTIVIFLSDFNRNFTTKMIKSLKSRFSSELDSGLLLILTMPEWCYPKLNDLPRTFNDEAERVKWRSKQVVDYAFLWQFSSNISKYYMQLEDDVITIRNYLSRIKKFVSMQKSNWTLLEFAKLGFIGKFYKSADLNHQARFVLSFYYFLPIDWLLGHFVGLRAQVKPIYANPPIFNHIGKSSSLRGDNNPLVEKDFKRNFNTTGK